MAKGKLLVVCLALVLLLSSFSFKNVSSKSEKKPYIRKTVNYTYTFDITGNVISSKVEVTIILRIDFFCKNLTLVDKEYFLKPETVCIEKGASPFRVESKGNLTKMYWRFRNVKETAIIIRYTADTLRRPPVLFNISLSGKDIVIDGENNTIRNVEEGKTLTIKVHVKNNSTFVKRVNGREFRFPYTSNIVITYPFKLVEVVEYSPKPNITSRQEDQSIMYWNFLLENNTSVNATLTVTSLGVWKSIWIPPVNIQLSEDPYMIISLIEKSKIEDIYNETLKSYEELRRLYNLLNSSESNISELASMLREIGMLQIEASSKLSEGLRIIRSVIDVAETVGYRHLEEYLTSAKGKLNSTLETLQEIEEIIEAGNFSESEYIIRKIEDIEQSILNVYSILDNINTVKIAVSIHRIKEYLDEISTGIRYMREAGIKQIDLADIIEEYYSNISEYRDSLKEKIDKLNRTLAELEYSYIKYKAYGELAEMLIHEFNESIEVYSDGGILDAYKEFQVKDIVGIKMPLLASELPPMRIEKHEEIPQESRWFFYKIILSVLVFLVVLKLFISKRRTVRIEEEDKEIMRLIEEIREKLKEGRE